MDIHEAIKARYSARSFTNQPVPKEKIEHLLETARWSPSWANTQPWQFHVATDASWERIKQGWSALFDQDHPFYPDIPVPTTWPEVQGQRAFATGTWLYSSLGVDRDDSSGRKRFRRRALEGFGAPTALFLFQPADLTAWSILDMGIVMGNIMLAAKTEGLDTCPEASMTYYPDVVRRELGIASNHRLVCGLALGFADPEAAVNRKERTRAPLAELVTWHH